MGNVRVTFAAAVRRLRGVRAVVALVGLTACPTVDLGDTPPDIGQCRPDRIFFEDRIWPEYIAPADPARSCVVAGGCHDLNNQGRSALRFDLTEPLDVDQNYQVFARFLNCASPDQSAALREPLAGVETHGGGDVFPSSADPAVVTFLEWFAQ